MKDVYELAIRLDTCRIIYRGDRDKLEKIRETYDEIEKRGGVYLNLLILILIVLLR